MRNIVLEDGMGISVLCRSIFLEILKLTVIQTSHMDKVCI